MNDYQFSGFSPQEVNRLAKKYYFNSPGPLAYGVDLFVNNIMQGLYTIDDVYDMAKMVDLQIRQHIANGRFPKQPSFIQPSPDYVKIQQTEDRLDFVIKRDITRREAWEELVGKDRWAACGAEIDTLNEHEPWIIYPMIY